MKGASTRLSTRSTSAKSDLITHSRLSNVNDRLAGIFSRLRPSTETLSCSCQKRPGKRIPEAHSLTCPITECPSYDLHKMERIHTHSHSRLVCWTKSIESVSRAPSEHVSAPAGVAQPCTHLRPSLDAMMPPRAAALARRRSDGHGGDPAPLMTGCGSKTVPRAHCSDGCRGLCGVFTALKPALATLP